METNARAAERGFLRRIRRLSRWQVAFLLPSAGLVVAMLLHATHWLTSAMVEHSGATSALFMLSLAFAALSVAMLLGVLLAFVATRLVGLYQSPFAEPRRDRWPLRLIAVGVFVLPSMMFAQHLQWYSASKSGGSGICPESVGGNDVLGFSVTADYLPPALTCSGDSVTGQEFSVTQHGFPFYGFIAGLILAVLGVVLLIVARARTRQR